MTDLTVLTVVYGAFVVGLVSPGRDLVLVSALSFQKGRVAAMWASLGIALGVGLWVVAAATGLSRIIESAPTLWDGVRYIGGGALIYMGSRALSACIRNASTPPVSDGSETKAMAPLLLGLATNLANPKAAVVLVGLTAVLGETYPEQTLILVLGMPVLTALWFVGVATVLSHQTLRDRLIENQRWLDGLSGLALVAVGIILIQSVPA